MNKERNVLAHIIKSWAQDHDTNYQIASPEPGDDGVDATSLFFSWLIKQTDANVDLVSLLDRLEFFVSSIKNKKYPDGMFCSKCKSWYQYSEPNQTDGSLLCYSCRNNPFT